MSDYQWRLKTFTLQILKTQYLNMDINVISEIAFGKIQESGCYLNL